MVDTHDVRILAKRRSQRALEQLIRIMQDSESAAQDKILAAIAILDRAFGRPPKSAQAQSDYKDLSDKALLVAAARLAKTRSSDVCPMCGGNPASIRQHAGNMPANIRRPAAASNIDDSDDDWDEDAEIINMRRRKQGRKPWRPSS